MQNMVKISEAKFITWTYLLSKFTRCHWPRVPFYGATGRKTLPLRTSRMQWETTTAVVTRGPIRRIISTVPVIYGLPMFIPIPLSYPVSRANTLCKPILASGNTNLFHRFARDGSWISVQRPSPLRKRSGRR